MSWPIEEAPPVIKGSLDANEDISVVEVYSVIDDVFDIGESNVESIEVRSEFSKFLENKESVKEVVVGGGEVDGRLDEINLNLSDELADNGKRKKGVGCGIGRQENYGSRRQDSGKSRISDPRIKIHFRHHLEDKVVVKEWGMIRPRSKPPLKVLEPRKVGLARIPIDTNLSRTSLLMCPMSGKAYRKDTDMSLIPYADADHARCQDIRRSTSGSAQFLGDKLVSWSSKKQNSIAISST
nr:retrovirus-related Pol polyprotein from transposon TNT 1-94 [Tanacetum cinerariifolium]